jgi:uncharacterized protein YqhQ
VNPAPSTQLANLTAPGPEVAYGGQACIEGVLMKGPRHAALAVRRRGGRIEILDREVRSRFPRLVKLPVLRGFFILWDMMTLGTWALRESAHRFELDMASEEAERKGADPVEQAPIETTSSPVPGFTQQLVMIVSLAVALFLFKVLPAIGASYVFGLLGWGDLKQLPDPTLGQQFLANLIEGLIKLSIFVGYIWGVGRIKEIGRVFEYHGAEHIVINAFEDDTKNQEMRFIQSHGVAHPRCGTSFIAIMILLSVLVFTLLDYGLLQLGVPSVNNLPIWWVRWPLRIVALPLLAGLSYEVIRAAFRYFGNPLIRPLLKFGMLFQVLTVRRPSDDQVEVSLAAFNRVKEQTEAESALAA